MQCISDVLHQNIQTMINFSKVDFWYGVGQPIFNQLDLNLEKGNIYGLLGKNGAGKTTLLRLIAGLLFPKGGDANVMGFEPSKRDPDMLEDLYFITEELHVPRMKIEQFVKFQAPFYPKFDRSMFDRFLRDFEIEPDRMLTNLSYGQKKKTMLAFGLATNTSLLILDEPTNGLDIPSKTQFRKVLTQAVSEERTVVISTHQVRDLANLMDPVIILDRGKILFQKSMEEISNKIQFNLVQSLTPPEGVLHAEQVPGGYMTLTKNENGRFTNVEPESLFNAIVSRNPEILNLF